MPSARSISNHVDQIAEKARSEVLPSLVENLLAGGGALTLDLSTAKREIIAITCHTIVETVIDSQPNFFLESDILELV